MHVAADPTLLEESPQGLPTRGSNDIKVSYISRRNSRRRHVRLDGRTPAKSTR